MSTIYAGAVALDYGKPGDGVWEATVLDKAGSPYDQITTWHTVEDGAPADFICHLRTGNLGGLSGVGEEFGLYAGTGLTDGDSYALLTDTQATLNNVTLNVKDEGVTVYKVDPSVPSYALGHSAPTGFGQGVGVWAGQDGDDYKWRVGDPTGDKIEWDGNQLEVIGTIHVGWGDIGDVPDRFGDEDTPTVAGLYLTPGYMGYHSGDGTLDGWQSYIDDAGNFYFAGDSDNYIQWDGIDLEVSGTIFLQNMISAGDISDVESGADSTEGVLYNTTITAGQIELSSVSGDADDLSDGENNFFADEAGVVKTETVLYNTTITAGQIELSSTIQSGEWYDESGVVIDAGTGIHIYGEDMAFSTHEGKGTDAICYVNADGEIMAGGGAVRLGGTHGVRGGISIKAGDGNYNQVKWLHDVGGELKKIGQLASNWGGGADDPVMTEISCRNRVGGATAGIRLICWEGEDENEEIIAMLTVAENEVGTGGAKLVTHGGDVVTEGGPINTSGWEWEFGGIGERVGDSEQIWIRINGQWYRWLAEIM